MLFSESPNMLGTCYENQKSCTLATCKVLVIDTTKKCSQNASDCCHRCIIFTHKDLLQQKFLSQNIYVLQTARDAKLYNLPFSISLGVINASQALRAKVSSGWLTKCDLAPFKSSAMYIRAGNECDTGRGDTAWDGWRCTTLIPWFLSRFRLRCSVGGEKVSLLDLVWPNAYNAIRKIQKAR